MRIPPTSTAHLDTWLSQLRERRQTWVGLDCGHRGRMLEQCLAGVRRVAGDWVREACLAQRIDPASPLAGEQWLAGPGVMLRRLRILAATMAAEARPGPVRRQRRRGEQQILEVTPAGALERAQFRGYRAELWLQPGHEPSQGAMYRAKERGEGGRGGVALVLGAGNVSSIGPNDVLHKLLVDDEVVLLKMHPVNEYLGPILEQAFAPLIDAGFLRVAYGGAEVGAYLCQHQLVDSIHLTGSHDTHDAIVWGPDADDQARRKAADDPVVHKRVTSELGCVSPVIVVPGRWSDAEILYQARSVAGMVVNNGSFNCNAAKLLVLSSDWPQRQAFVRTLGEVLASTPARFAYYPGAADRYRRFLNHYPRVEALGGRPAEGYLPWTLVPQVPAQKGEYALGTEAFCGVLAQTQLPGTGADFLAAASHFVNEQVWGSLSCMLIVDPPVQAEMDGALEDAVATLRYGGVAINAWSGYLFALATTSWGAFPGNRLSDVGSGIGVVGNSLLYDHPQKSVLWAPFTQWPKPAWFPDHRTLDVLGRRLATLEASPTWLRLAAAAVAAARG